MVRLLLALALMTGAPSRASEPAVVGFIDGTTPVPSTDHRFGAAVALATHWAFVGAPGEDVVFDEGRVYAWRRVGDLWMPAGAFGGADATITSDQGLRFGEGLAAEDAPEDPPTALLRVGAPGYEYEHGSDVGTGAVGSFFAPSMGQHVWVRGAGFEPGDGFGTVIALDEYRALLGAPHFGVAPYEESGGARFVNDYPTIQATQSYAAGANEGAAVAAEGRVAVVGAPGMLDDDGIVKIFLLPEVPPEWGSWWTSELGRYAEVRGPESGGRFGSGVATDGERVFVGAPLDIDGSAAVGSLTVLAHDGFEWKEEAVLWPSDLPAGARFGERVATAAGWVVVGAPGVGAVYAFRHDGAAWVEEHRVAWGSAADGFATALATADEFVLVGAPNATRGVAGAGRAWIAGAGSTQPTELSPHEPDHAVGTDVITLFAGGLHQARLGGGLDAATWTAGAGGWAGPDTLVPQGSVPVVGDVAFDGDHAAVLENGLAKIVHVFERTGATWAPTRTIPLLGTPATVALHGDTLAVGDPTAKTVDVWERSGAEWMPAVTVSGGAEGGSTFGTSLALDDGWLAVGSIDADVGPALEVGAVALFERTSAGWVAAGRVHGALAVAGDDFGSVVSLDMPFVAVGAPDDDAPAAPDTGSAYVFERIGGVWMQVAHLFDAAAHAHDRFGASLAIDGEALAVGAPSVSDVTDRIGQVHLYDGTTGTWQHAATIPSPGAAFDDGFGARVDLRDRLLAVGVPRFPLATERGSRILVYDFDRPNDAPVVDLDANNDGVDASLSVGDDLPLLLAPTGTVSDGDGHLIERLVAHLDAAPDGASESLVADAAGTGLTVTGSTTHRVEVIGPGTAAEFQAVLRTLAWQHTGPDPSTTARLVWVNASDFIDVGASARALVFVSGDDDTDTDDGQADDTDDEPIQGSGACATGVPGALGAWVLLAALLTRRRR